MASRFKFAKLISLVTAIANRRMTEEQIEQIDYILNEDAHGGADPQLVSELLACMKMGKKIEAIKNYRALTGMGLIESKDAVEAFWTYPPMQHPQTEVA